MTPDQWTQASPEQRAEHVAVYGPPPVGYGTPPTMTMAPDTSPTPHFAPPVTKASRIAAGVVALLLTIAIGILVVGRGSKAPAASGPTTSAAASTTCSANCVTVPYLLGLTGPDATAALNRAGFTGNREQSAAGSTGSVVVSQYPVSGVAWAINAPVNLTFGAKATTAPVPAPAVVAPPAPAKAITARQWALIAKAPDQHVGESIVVFGQVKQFDSATGESTFRASVDGVKHKVSYGYADYETNTVLTGTTDVLGDIVEGDLFRAEVVVSGSLSYDTTLGGSTTVPQLLITKIEVTGTAK